MKTHRISETQCPACSRKFNIHANRSKKIENPLPGGWFYDAVNQFEKFNEVTCPYCKTEYISKEARLFGVFKSPYAAIIATILFVASIVGFFIFLKYDPNSYY